MKEYRDRLKLSQVRAFVAVATFQNFSEAALHLQLSQSAISHAIASLEDELGIILFTRGRHGATLTPVGEEILGHANRMLQALDSMVQTAERSRGLHGGQVRVASFRSAATYVMTPAIAQFRQQYPGITVIIKEHQTNADVEQALLDGQVEVGFTYLPTSNHFESWELLRDEYIVLAPPNAAFSQSLATSTLSWEDLNTYPIIMPPKGDGCRRVIEHYFTSHSYKLNIAYEMVEDSTTISMVQRGLGITIIARLAAEPLPDNIRVYRLPIPIERIIGVAVVADALQPPAVFAFLETVRALVKERLHSGE
jgi:DNA-binding transcriptional LysR family regulator